MNIISIIEIYFVKLTFLERVENMPALSIQVDKEISNVVRSFRDRHGTRHRPIGIAVALQHLLQDLGVPIHAFGEYTYTSLLTCCRTPNEARRIFKLMRDQNHDVSLTLCSETSWRHYRPQPVSWLNKLHRLIQPVSVIKELRALSSGVSAP